MYKSLFKVVVAIITQPTKTWKMIEHRYNNRGEGGAILPKDYEMFLNHYFFPILGLLAIVSFVSIGLREDFNLEIALKSCVVVSVSYFGSYYLVAYLLNEFWGGYLKRPRDLRRFQLFVGFSSALVYTWELVNQLFPDYFFMQLFVLYTFYIVWQGLLIFIKVEESKVLKLTAIASLLIILTPILIGKFLQVLMPGLHI